jgi:glutaredoxin
MVRFITALCALLLTAAVGAQSTTTLYKSVGPDGKVVYSDRPGPGARDARTLRFQNLPASPLSAETLAYVAQLQKSADQRAAAAPVAEVLLFSATWCGYCKQAKSYLASKQVAYREIDIDSKQGLAAYAQAGGRSGVPLLVVNGQRVSGFSAAAYDALLFRSK